MPVHPVIRELLDRISGQPPSEATVLTIEDQRKAADQMMLTLAALSEEGPEVGDVRDQLVPGPHGEFLVRVFTPEGTGPFPVYVTFHGEGGAWETLR